MHHLRSSILPVLGAGALAVSALGGLTTTPATAAAAADGAPMCHGKPATIVADDGLVTGTSDDDVIVAGPDSRVLAGAGDDAVCGSAEVFGGPGDDYIASPGSGPTKYRGGSGNDVILVARQFSDVRGGPGDDDITSGLGKQSIAGGPGRDRISTGPGRDFAVGGRGADIVRGGRGSDRLEGGQGSDVLRGGSNGADDLLVGGRGRDALYGGPGQDTGRAGPGADFCAPSVEKRFGCTE